MTHLAFEHDDHTGREKMFYYADALNAPQESKEESMKRATSLLNNRLFWTVLTVALTLALLVGFAIPPAITLAAGPAQAANPIDTAASALYALITLGMTAVAGGFVAFLLDDLPQWKNWTNAGAKTSIVLVLNALIGAALLTVQPYIPSGLAALPSPLVVFLGFALSYIVNQLTHQADVRFSEWKKTG